MERKINVSSSENTKYISDLLGNPFDLVTRTFNITEHTTASIAFIDHMVNKVHVNDFIIRPIISTNVIPADQLWNKILNSLVEMGETKTANDMESILPDVLCGDTVLFIDGFEKALIFGTREWVTKGIGEPKTESVVRGPAEALNETAVISISQIRRRLKDPNLRINSFKLGRRSQTDVFVFYIDDIVDKSILNEVESRINKIDIDAILDTGYIQELIQDNKLSPFSQMQYTEKPDSVVGHLLEGKVIILQDGSPNALIAPTVFSQLYNTAEDYYENYVFATFLRFIRFSGLMISLFLSALYIAFISFHPEMLPPELMLSIASSRFSVPFSTVTEIFMMEMGVEILREASIRIPNPLGTTIGIVGALVIGNSAVSAGFVSPTVVIIVGLAAIASHTSPSYSASFSIRIIRFLIIGAAALFGLYGIVLATLLLIMHILSLKSFGVEYFTPIVPFKFNDLKDVIIRAPWSYMKKRPTTFHPKDKVRLGGKEVE